MYTLAVCRSVTIPIYTSLIRVHSFLHDGLRYNLIIVCYLYDVDQSTASVYVMCMVLCTVA